MAAPRGRGHLRSGAKTVKKPAIGASEQKLLCPARFITALLTGPRGGIWVAGEDTGIYHQKAGQRQWKHFHKSNSSGLVSNSIYSLCIDRKGRLWAGTSRHGVCVYNGKKWKHYGIVNGPLGSHVVAIANDPRNNSVWMCTEAGVSIYRTGHGRWRYITRMNGLPPNPDCVAFNKRGTAFVGTLCNGLAISRYPYKRWRIVRGPWHMPMRATGYGLPSNLINAVLVGRYGTVYVGTDLGLAISRNGGESFRYERGQDYAAKVQGLWHPPQDFAPPPRRVLDRLLPGDHITCLAQGARGNLWLGTWRNGYARLNPRTGAIIKSQSIPALSKLDGYIAKLAPRADGSLLIGRYGSGVSQLKQSAPNTSRRDSHMSRRRRRTRTAGIARPLIGNPLPQAAAPPSGVALTSMDSALEKGTKQAAHIRFPYACFLRNDWRTQGDWTARYGREYGILCSAHFDLSFHVVSGDYAENVDGVCGPHHRLPFESMREWETSADTDNPKSLYVPELGYRRQTNWDDHGETYPTTFQGPDLWMRVRLSKPGLYRLSLYFFNKDGHTLYDRPRDWLVEVYPVQSGYRKALTRPLLATMAFQTNRVAQNWCRRAMAAPPLAAARAVNIWNPVYTRFAIAGPGQYMVRIVRGSSVNAELCGIFIDRADVPRTIFDNKAMTCLWGVNYCAPNVPNTPGGVIPRGHFITSAWQHAKHAFGRSGLAARATARLLAYRDAVAHHASPALLARWRWRLDIWKPQDRSEFNHMMNKAFWAMLKQWKGLKAFMTKDHELQSNSGELGHG